MSELATVASNERHLARAYLVGWLLAQARDDALRRLTSSLERSAAPFAPEALRIVREEIERRAA